MAKAKGLNPVAFLKANRVPVKFKSSWIDLQSAEASAALLAVREAYHNNQVDGATMAEIWRQIHLPAWEKEYGKVVGSNSGYQNFMRERTT